MYQVIRYMPLFQKAFKEGGDGKDGNFYSKGQKPYTMVRYFGRYKIPL